MKKSNTSLFVLVVFLATLLFSCSKSDKDTPVSFESSWNYLVASLSLQDIFLHVDGIGKSMLREDGYFNTSAHMTIDNIDSFPRTVTLIFDKTNSANHDARPRSGTIEIIYSKEWLQNGTTASINFVNYELEGIVLNGQMVITNRISSEDSNVVLNMSCKDVNLSTAHGDFVYGADLAITFEDVNHTEANVFDDVYRIEGTGEGVNHLGNSFIMEISNYLLKKSTCLYIASGTADIIEGNDFPKIIYFGEGICDETVTIYNGTDKYSFKILNPTF